MAFQRYLVEEVGIDYADGLTQPAGSAASAGHARAGSRRPRAFWPPAPTSGEPATATATASAAATATADPAGAHRGITFAGPEGRPAGRLGRGRPAERARCWSSMRTAASPTTSARRRTSGRERLLRPGHRPALRGGRHGCAQRRGAGHGRPRQRPPGALRCRHAGRPGRAGEPRPRCRAGAIGFCFGGGRCGAPRPASRALRRPLRSTARRPTTPTSPTRNAAVLAVYGATTPG